jgi:hypothetical protein
MTDLNRQGSFNLDAIKSDGTAIVANRIGALTTLGVTLVNGTTYFFPFGAPHAAVPSEAPLTSFQLRWDASIIMTVTVETTLVPATFQPGDPRGPALLSDFDVTAGFWLQQNPTTAYVPATGGTPTNMTVAVAGGSAGGCEFDLGNLGARRGRIKMVVAGTGGLVLGAIWGKAAA